MSMLLEIAWVSVEILSLLPMKLVMMETLSTEMVAIAHAKWRPTILVATPLCQVSVCWGST